MKTLIHLVYRMRKLLLVCSNIIIPYVIQGCNL